ncbi:MAG: hypothetical protein ACP5N2_01995 [Candidatus Nanoarchaeia archaeon]
MNQTSTQPFFSSSQSNLESSFNSGKLSGSKLLINTIEGSEDGLTPLIFEEYMSQIVGASCETILKYEQALEDTIVFLSVPWLFWKSNDYTLREAKRINSLAIANHVLFSSDSKEVYSQFMRAFAAKQSEKDEENMLKTIGYLEEQSKYSEVFAVLASRHVRVEKEIYHAKKAAIKIESRLGESYASSRFFFNYHIKKINTLATRLNDQGQNYTYLQDFLNKFVATPSNIESSDKMTKDTILGVDNPIYELHNH